MAAKFRVAYAFVCPKIKEHLIIASNTIARKPQLGAGCMAWGNSPWLWDWDTVVGVPRIEMIIL